MCEDVPVEPVVRTVKGAAAGVEFGVLGWER